MLHVYLSFSHAVCLRYKKSSCSESSCYFQFFFFNFSFHSRLPLFAAVKRRLRREIAQGWSSGRNPLQFFTVHQRVTKRCRLSWLTNSAGGEGGEGIEGSQPMSTDVYMEPNKLRRSYSIFNLPMQLINLQRLNELTIFV
jgi:hypothetical protein